LTIYNRSVKNINSINKELSKVYGDKVKAELKDNCIFVIGELDTWADTFNACNIAATKYSTTHVVNDIECKEVKDVPIHRSSIEDKVLDNKEVDVLVIGGGITGTSILRELSRYKLKLLLVDKEADLANGASSRNDGEVHPGVDLGKGSLKQKYVLLGNRMYPEMCKELDVPFIQKGQYAGIVLNKLLRPILNVFVAQRKSIGATDSELINNKKVHELEPYFTDEFNNTIYSPLAGCVCPYGLTIAMGENAVSNGAEVSLNTVVLSMEVKDNNIISVSTNRGTIYPKVVINAAGVFAEEIARMANDRFFSIHPRKGTDIIMDKKIAKYINGIASTKDLLHENKNTKGGGSLHTVHDNVLLGPDAIETWEKENLDTSQESIDKIFKKQVHTIPELNQKDIITYFTGVRAPTFEEDFIIEKGRKTNNIYHLAGIQSPGLTAAPAFAKDASKEVVEMLSKAMEVKINESFNPKRVGIPHLSKMNDEERNEYIKKNPDYGIIVCRCEEVSKGEIIDALERPIKVPTIDGIKRRVRPGMGRCQGGFCAPLVSKIIAEHEGIKINEVNKQGEKAFVTYGETKGDGSC